MNFWVLLQVLINIIFVTSTIALWIRLSRPQKDDPRLSRGLQILQTKISVLEDLSDRTETQVNQLNSLMEQKIKEVQNHLLNADKTIQSIETSRSKSLEVAQIFQDRIPHKEIIERKNTVKYVKAARLAHQGLDIDEIEKQVDLSRGEIEFIAKVNRNQLQFSEEDLPAWAKNEEVVENEETTTESKIELTDSVDVNNQSILESKPLIQEKDRISLNELGDKFRQAMAQNKEKLNSTPFIEINEPKQNLSDEINRSLARPQAAQAQAPTQTFTNSKGKQVEVKKVIFPRVNMDSNLG